jgi:murein DD-endopeptidase MepM/ murein hydrolase activator NlpD
MFGVSVNTIKWANDISGSIREGDKLVILPVSGVNYTISKGDTLQGVAKKFKADLDEIIKFNDIKLGETLAIGTKIIIPDGEIQTVVATKATSKLRGVGGLAFDGYYVRPIVGGRKSQGLHGYNGVDIASSIGTPITASANGTVIVVRPTGYNGGYGKYIVITHPNGTQTLYAHMNSVSVVQGQTVVQGDVIGTLGNTGKSTGPHIHFEIRGANIKPPSGWFYISVFFCLYCRASRILFSSTIFLPSKSAMVRASFMTLWQERADRSRVFAARSSVFSAFSSISKKFCISRALISLFSFVSPFSNRLLCSFRAFRTWSRISPVVFLRSLLRIIFS